MSTPPRVRDRYGRGIYAGTRESIIDTGDLRIDRWLWVNINPNGTGILYGFDWHEVRERAEWYGHAKRHERPEYNHYFSTFRVRLSERAVELARQQAERYAEWQSEAGSG